MARTYRLGLTPAIYRDILGDPDNRALCYYCTNIAHEVDHIVPVSRGGAERDYDNLAPACMECNREKRDLTPDEWAASRRAEGKPWPIPSIWERIKFVCDWARPRIEKVNGRTVICDYEKFRRVLMETRDCAELGSADAA
jgi:CRISPR/Cas system Type II protein with McrA/HNH and RuvC-like nuclease domain